MSIVYITNIKYRHFINKVKDIKVEILFEPIYNVPHVLLKLNNNRIFAFEEDNSNSYTEEGNLLFEVYGANNPKEIFDLILKQFPHLTIQDEYARMDWRMT